MDYPPVAWAAAMQSAAFERYCGIIGVSCERGSALMVREGYRN
jgi:hypothetical protein